MNRRRFLRTTALAGTCGAIAGCHRIRPRAAVPITGNSCDLVPAVVSPEREIRTVVGLRPYRPSGFVVKAEKLGEKLIIHNYGHGGGGITLSWGTSQLATELLSGDPSAVAVIGCGAVGLATARLLQDRGLRVTIYASELPPRTTSNIAGGQWSPFDVYSSGKQTTAFMNQFLRATELAYQRYQTLVGARYGVHWIRNYSLRHHQFDEGDMEGKESPIRRFMPGMRDLSEADHPFSGYQYVRLYDTMLIEPPIYLNTMLTDFRIAGGVVRVVKFEHVTQFQQLTEPVIFNCTGLGARALFGDQELTPIKGQLTVLLPQAEVNYLTLMEDDLYMFPRTDGILLGGLFQEGEWSLSVDEPTRARVLKGHAEFFGSFGRCPQSGRKDFQQERSSATNRSNLPV
jgi:D-amino-acid oxidase